MELEDPLANYVDTFNTFFTVEVPVVAVLEETGTPSSGFEVQQQQEQIPSSSKTLPTPTSTSVQKIGTENEKKGIPPRSRSNVASKIFLGNIMSIPSTERMCCVCHQDKRSAIPQTAMIHFWLAEKIWIPTRNRCCGHHLEVKSGRKIFTKDAVKILREHRKMGVALSGLEAGKWIHWLTDQINERERWWRQFAKESGF